MSIGSYEFRADPGTTVTVYIEVAGHIELVTLYTDETGATEGPNPLPVDESGWIRIFAANGEYAMRVDQRSPDGLFLVGDDGSGGQIMIEVA